MGNIIDKTDFIVNVDDKYDEFTYYIKFSNFNSILYSSEKEKNKIIFYGVPANQPITVIGLGNTKDEFVLGMTDANTDDKNIVISNFELLNKEDITQRLKRKFGTEL